MLSPDRLDELLQRFPDLTIGLLGDLFLDRYLEIEPGLDVASIETGLTAFQVTRVRNSPGALGTVINNLAALGVGRILPITVIGDDGLGDDLHRELTARAIDCEFVLRDAGRLTPTYMKPLRPNDDGEAEELNRFDIRTCAPMAETTTAELCARISTALESVDGLIVIDHIAEQNWGIVNDIVRSHLRELSMADPRKLIFIDSRAQIHRFDFGSLKGNEFEIAAAGEALGMSPTDLPTVTAGLCRRTGRTAWCTLGERGILFAQPEEAAVSVPAFEVDGPVDIVGAGDAATSGIVASLLAGATENEAAVVGNLTASITVAQIGTTGTASPEQLRAALRKQASGAA